MTSFPPQFNVSLFWFPYYSGFVHWNVWYLLWMSAHSATTRKSNDLAQYDSQECSNSHEDSWNTPFSTDKVHELNINGKMQTYRHVAYVTSSSSTMERLELDYLQRFLTCVQYWRSYLEEARFMTHRSYEVFICHKVADISATLQTDSKVYHCKEILLWMHRKCVLLWLKWKVPLTGRKKQLLKAVDVCVVNNELYKVSDIGRFQRQLKVYLSSSHVATIIHQSASWYYFWVGVIPTHRAGVYFVFTIKQYATFGSR